MHTFDTFDHRRPSPYSIQNNPYLCPLSMSKLFTKSSKKAKSPFSGTAITAPQIIDQLPYAVVVTDLKGMVQFWTPAAERMYGFSEFVALGQHISFLFPQEEYEKFFATAIPGVVQNDIYEMVLKSKNESGKAILTRLRLSRYKDKDNEAVGLIYCLSEVSD